MKTVQQILLDNFKSATKCCGNLYFVGTKFVGQKTQRTNSGLLTFYLLDKKHKLLHQQNLLDKKHKKRLRICWTILIFVGQKHKFVRQNTNFVGQKTQTLLDENTKFVGQKHKVQIQPKTGLRTFSWEDLCASARWLSRAVTHTGERGTGRQAGVHADELAGRHARTQAGRQGGRLRPTRS